MPTQKPIFHGLMVSIMSDNVEYIKGQEKAILRTAGKSESMTHVDLLNASTPQQHLRGHSILGKDIMIPP